MFNYGNTRTNTYSMAIDGPEGTVSGDAFEPNQTFATSSKLGIGDQILTGLSIHSSSDDDWYQWTSTLNGVLNVSAQFSHTKGNVDLELYDSAQKLIGSSTGLGNSEQVTTTVVAGQLYTVARVHPRVRDAGKLHPGDRRPGAGRTGGQVRAERLLPDRGVAGF